MKYLVLFEKFTGEKYQALSELIGNNFEKISLNESSENIKKIFQDKLKNILDSNKRMNVVNTNQEFEKSGLIELLNSYRKEFQFLQTPINMIQNILNINERPGQPNTERIELRKKIYSFLENEIPKLLNNDAKYSTTALKTKDKEYSNKYPKITRDDIKDLNSEFDRLLQKYQDNKDLQNLYNQYIDCKDNNEKSLKDVDYDYWYDKLREIFKNK